MRVEINHPGGQKGARGDYQRQVEDQRDSLESLGLRLVDLLHNAVQVVVQDELLQFLEILGLQVTHLNYKFLK